MQREAVKSGKSFLVFVLVVALAFTSVNLPSLTVYAAGTNAYEAKGEHGAIYDAENKQVTFYVNSDDQCYANIEHMWYKEYDSYESAAANHVTQGKNFITEVGATNLTENEEKTRKSVTVDVADGTGAILYYINGGAGHARPDYEHIIIIGADEGAGDGDKPPVEGSPGEGDDKIVNEFEATGEHGATYNAANKQVTFFVNSADKCYANIEHMWYKEYDSYDSAAANHVTHGKDFIAEVSATNLTENAEKTQKSVTVDVADGTGAILYYINGGAGHARPDYEHVIVINADESSGGGDEPPVEGSPGEGDEQSPGEGGEQSPGEGEGTDAETPTITIHPNNKNYTVGDTAEKLEVEAAVSDGGTLTYQWYKNSDGSTTSGELVGTNKTYTPSTVTEGTTYYYCIVTNTNDAVNGNKTAIAKSNAAKIVIESASQKTKYTVTFDSDGGTSVPAQTVESGKTATMPTAPTKEGYTFAGWYNGATEYDFNTPVEAALTLTAKWVLDDGSGEDGAAVPTITIQPTGKNYVAGETATALTVTANASDGGTLTYQWYQNAKNSVEGATKISGATSASYIPITTVAGTTYYFCKVTNTKGGEIASKDSDIAEIKVSAAQQQSTKYTVTFDSNGGTAVAAQTVESGKTATMPAAPTRSGYAFVGWFNGTTAYNFNTPVTSNLTLTAKWNENKTQDPGTDSDINQVKVSKIEITGMSKSIAAGKKIALKATVTPANAANKKVTWKSSNTKYATVNSKGVVTTKKAGVGKSVTITATAKDGSNKKATYKITLVNKAVKKVKLTAKTKTVKAGKKLTVKPTVTLSGKIDKKSKSTKANKTLAWKSSNTKYATVSSKGVVKANKAGKGKTVTITATATDGSGKKATIKIKISK